jgi:hypothetical protein
VKPKISNNGEPPSSDLPPRADDEDEDAINSELDDEDEDEDEDDPAETGGALVMAQYDKVSSGVCCRVHSIECCRADGDGNVQVQRVKNKWKIQLKDGVVNVQGRDYLFNRCNGYVCRHSLWGTRWADHRPSQQRVRVVDGGVFLSMPAALSW